jgi:nitrate reductase NapAB chaperone NapD
MPEALVNLNLDNSKNLREVISEIAKIENVEWARLVFGPTDGVVYVKTSRWLDLETTVAKVNTIEGVLETDTRILVPEKE